MQEVKRLAGQPWVPQIVLLGEISIGVLMASSPCELSCRAQSCPTAGTGMPTLQASRRGHVEWKSRPTPCFRTATQGGLKGIEQYSAQTAAKPGYSSPLVFRCCGTRPGAVWSIAGEIQPALEALFTMLGHFSTPQVLAALLVAPHFTRGTPSPSPCYVLPSPQFQTLLLPLFTEDSSAVCVITGDSAAVTSRGWRI